MSNPIDARRQAREEALHRAAFIGGAADAALRYAAVIDADAALIDALTAENDALKRDLEAAHREIERQRARASRNGDYADFLEHKYREDAP